MMTCPLLRRAATITETQRPKRKRNLTPVAMWIVIMINWTFNASYVVRKPSLITSGHSTLLFPFPASVVHLHYCHSPLLPVRCESARPRSNLLRQYSFAATVITRMTAAADHYSVIDDDDIAPPPPQQDQQQQQLPTQLIPVR